MTGKISRLIMAYQWSGTIAASARQRNGQYCKDVVELMRIALVQKQNEKKPKEIAISLFT